MLIVQLYWVHGASRVLRITPSEFSYRATNDQLQGGMSSSSLAYLEEKVVLNCELKSSPDYPWPYCGISISLGDTPSSGLDLSSYHTIRLEIDFEQVGSDVPPSTRLYLRNFNPAYSVIEEDYSQKYNGLEFTPNTGQGVLDIPIKNLQVMTWWLSDNQISIEHSAPEFTNTTMVELATGAGHDSGRYKMTINGIAFVGHYVSGESLMLSLLVFWISMALVYSVVEIRRSNRLIIKAHSRQSYLDSLNQELQQQNSHFAELANRDALTGAMNRHAIRVWLEKEYESEERDETLSILYLDIDHFKCVNDTYGHSMGDDILREFTMVTLSMLDDDHRLVRWGGEEFIVFLPNMTANDARVLAEKIRSKINAHMWVHGDPLTTSIGVAQLENGDTKMMIARADEALYTAKRDGRNQVMVAK